MFLHINNTMVILLKTTSVRVSSIKIMQVRVQNKGKSVWKSRYDGDVSSVWAASSNNTAESKYDMLVSSMTIIAHNSLFVLLVHITSMHRPGSDATVVEHSISKKVL